MIFVFHQRNIADVYKRQSDMCIVNGNKYFIYNNEKIAVDGYDYMTVSELIACLLYTSISDQIIKKLYLDGCTFIY